jgi:redox-sensing transcriptional repressor
MNKETLLSKKQLERYPVYLSYLKSMKDKGIVNVSAPILAEGLNFSEEQVRKDLAAISSHSGKPKSGRNLIELINDLESFLGYHEQTKAILVGVGHLGEAFLKFSGFNDFGLEVICGFDNDDNKIGNSIKGKPIYSIEDLKEVVKNNDIKIAIITTPNNVAQKVSDLLADAGIKGIWNFATVHLNVPKGIVIENVNLASSLAVLSHKL